LIIQTRQNLGIFACHMCGVDGSNSLHTMHKGYKKQLKQSILDCVWVRWIVHVQVHQNCIFLAHCVTSRMPH